ncbi:hypothetical protein QBC39DRAFT_421440 [Podospora conica]|nr:hypothetical protein QBC39DRAFT_421440 [Schizothecium conicum]
MSSVKRKMPNLGGLQRRVRPRVEPEPESDVQDSDSEAPSEEDVSARSGSDSDEDDDNSDEDGSDIDDDASDSSAGPGIDATQLSFGALARAQAAALAKKSKKPAAADSATTGPDEHEREERKALSAAERRAKLKRSSKHAPAEMTSKKPVSRKRDFIAVPKPQARDPRFMPLGAGAVTTTPGGAGTRLEEVRARQAYAFLDDYQKDEMKQLAAAAKKERDPAAREKLQRALMSMESRMKTQKRKDREYELLAEHRKKEKELVKQGKTPFYLKKSEQKKALLLDQFASMKKGQVDKAIERRRKKVAGKEKKLLPYARRTAEDR